MVTVIVPALNEARTIGRVVRAVQSSSLVHEILVVDDGSVDDTTAIARQAGAKVITSTMLGKGASMADGAGLAANELILFLDGDLEEFADDLVDRMVAPLMNSEADFVKAKFDRSAGRVTQLAAKPLLRVFFPELAHIEQPLGGIVATRKSLITSLCLEDDYGVDVGLLIDVASTGAGITEVDVGFIEHDSQPLAALGSMSEQVIRTILERAYRYGRLSKSQLQAAGEHSRHESANLNRWSAKLKSASRIALLDMDGTLLQGRFVEQLSESVGVTEQLSELLDHPELSATDRTGAIAAMFRGVSQERFKFVAKSIPLTRGAKELVVGLKRRGYAVGIVTDSYHVAAEIVRRRVFADFCIAHLLEFKHGLATGRVAISEPMLHASGCSEHTICKRNVLFHLQDMDCRPDHIVAIGDNDGDACLLQAADLGIAFEPKTQHVRESASLTIQGSIANALARIDNHQHSMKAVVKSA